MTLPAEKGSRSHDIIREFTKVFSILSGVRDTYKYSPDYNNAEINENNNIVIRRTRLYKSYWIIIKRVFDICFSLILMIFIFSFLWPIIIIAIKITSRGNIFYKQERLGKDGKKFILYKFRTMHQGCNQFDENGIFLQVTKNDPRVTAIGKILRRTNLDELPQFLNIIKGDMSIVGPRPHVTIMDFQIKNQIEDYMLRYSVKPGIIGWAQVNGLRGETKDLSLMEKRIEYDLWYIENWSLLLDLRIILRTIWNMIKGDKNAY